jgi:tripartite-type tricarboxylate transporter receptor subunit TctC
MNRKVPVNNWQELVAYSKEHPDKLNFGSFGLGGDSHLIVEWMKHVTGANITHIPYKGASDALLAFTAGDIQLLYLIVGNLDLPRQINEGEIKGLLVPGKTRNPIIPNVPTFAESGLPSDQIGYETWFGMFAPKGTPQPIIKKLNADFTAIVKTPEFAQQYLTTKGFEPEGDSADHFAQFIQDDLRKAKTFVGITGVALEQ